MIRIGRNRQLAATHTNYQQTVVYSGRTYTLAYERNVPEALRLLCLSSKVPLTILQKTLEVVAINDNLQKNLITVNVETVNHLNSLICDKEVGATGIEAANNITKDADRYLQPAPKPSYAAVAARCPIQTPQSQPISERRRVPPPIPASQFIRKPKLEDDLL